MYSSGSTLFCALLALLAVIVLALFVVFPHMHAIGKIFRRAGKALVLLPISPFLWRLGHGRHHRSTWRIRPNPQPTTTRKPPPPSNLPELADVPPLEEWEGFVGDVLAPDPQAARGYIPEAPHVVTWTRNPYPGYVA